MKAPSKFKDETLDMLFNGIMKLKSLEECYDFFEDLCTIKELETMSQRLEVARMLLAKKTFNEIVQATGASTTTISRVNRCLNYGDGGYRKVLEEK